jgi:hypothetical protein
VATSDPQYSSSSTRKQHSARLGQGRLGSAVAVARLLPIPAVEAGLSSFCAAKKSDSAVARQAGPSGTTTGAVAAAAQLRGMGPATVIRVVFASTSSAWDDRRWGCRPYISAYGSERPTDWDVERTVAPSLDVRWVFSVCRKCSPLFTRQPLKGTPSRRSRRTEEYAGGY